MARFLAFPSFFGSLQNPNMAIILLHWKGTGGGENGRGEDGWSGVVVGWLGWLVGPLSNLFLAYTGWSGTGVVGRFDEAQTER